MGHRVLLALRQGGERRDQSAAVRPVRPGRHRSATAKDDDLVKFCSARLNNPDLK